MKLLNNTQAKKKKSNFSKISKGGKFSALTIS